MDVNPLFECGALIPTPLCRAGWNGRIPGRDRQAESGGSMRRWRLDRERFQAVLWAQLKGEYRTSRCDGDNLPAPALIGNGIGADDAAGVLTPQFFARIGIQRKKISLIAAAEDQFTGRR